MVGLRSWSVGPFGKNLGKWGHTAHAVAKWRLFPQMSPKIVPAGMARRDGSRFGSHGPPPPANTSSFQDSGKLPEVWGIAARSELWGIAYGLIFEDTRNRVRDDLFGLPNPHADYYMSTIPKNLRNSCLFSEVPVKRASSLFKLTSVQPGPKLAE